MPLEKNKFILDIPTSHVFNTLKVNRNHDFQNIPPHLHGPTRRHPSPFAPSPLQEHGGYFTTGPPPFPSVHVLPPTNKALSSAYQPLVCLNTALLNPDFWGSGLGVIVEPSISTTHLMIQVISGFVSSSLLQVVIAIQVEKTCWSKCVHRLLVFAAEREAKVHHISPKLSATQIDIWTNYDFTNLDFSCSLPKSY